jgi:hypothetical protein
MKTKTLFLLTFVLIVPLTARAQTATQTTPPQPAKRYSSLDDDPQFKRLSPEQQDMVRKAMGKLDNAIAAEQKNTAAPAGAKPQAATSPVQSGCDASPVKKPHFHIPKAFQDAINKQAKQVGSKTGIDVDPNAPAKAVNDAQQKLPPCPPTSAAPATPAKK